MNIRTFTQMTSCKPHRTEHVWKTPLLLATSMRLMHVLKSAIASWSHSPNTAQHEWPLRTPVTGSTSRASVMEMQAERVCEELVNHRWEILMDFLYKLPTT